MQCNIDQRGRQARLRSGSITLLTGVILLVVAIVQQSTALIVAGGIVSLIGAFVIYEGAKGWCALRAMGVKTRL